MSEKLDLGMGHFAWFVAFAPDRSIPANAERFRDQPDDPRVGLIVTHDCPKHGPQYKTYIGLNPRLNTASACWTVESWEPLTLSPSLLSTCCGDHGFIRNGRWIPA